MTTTQQERIRRAIRRVKRYTDHDIENSAAYDAIAELRAVLEEPDGVCEWTHEETGLLRSACGELYSCDIDSDSPLDPSFGFRFCPFCGKRIVETKPEG